MTPEPTSPAPDPKVMAALEKMGFKPNPEEKKLADGSAAPTDDPMALLNIGEHPEEDIQRFDLPPGMVDEISPPEKERVARGKPSDNEDPSKYWERRLDGYGKVTVSEEEKDIYQDAVLSDERFRLVLNLNLGNNRIDIGIRSLYTSEKEVIALAIKKCVDEHPLKLRSGDLGQTMQESSLGTAFLFRCWILCQIETWNGERIFPGNEPFDARPEKNEEGEEVLPSDSKKVGDLARRVTVMFGNMHQAKTKALIRAIQIFETKQLILEDAMFNRDFWNPAGAS